MPFLNAEGVLDGVSIFFVYDLEIIMRIAFYLLSILTADFVTAAFPPLHVGRFIVSLGTLLIGATFILNNAVKSSEKKLVM